MKRALLAPRAAPAGSAMACATALLLSAVPSGGSVFTSTVLTGSMMAGSTVASSMVAGSVLAAATFATSTVAAQDDTDMDFTQGGEAGADEGADMDFTQGGEAGADEGADMDFTQGPEDTADTPAGGGDLIGDLAGGGEEIDAAADRPERATEATEEIFAVQQIYALRINRVEIAPSFAQTLNDPFVSHPAISLGLNYWWTNVLAIGANFLWYEGLESQSDLNFFVGRATRLAVPVSAYQFGAHLAFTYVPLYGKFSMFNEFIFQWDSYVVGGVGIMRTRPVPVIDEVVRNFQYDIRVAFNLGIGLRVFVSRWLAVFGEIRNYMYLEQLEALDAELGEGRYDEATWLQDSPAFTNNVTVHLGLTFFFPFEFEYRLPR